MTRIYRQAVAAACLMLAGALAQPMSATAMQLLEAVDHAELSAEVSATEINRIALLGDRVLRVVRAPDGFAVEHDAATGDLYLRLVGTAPGDGGRHAEASLFVGTEKGFTYRLTLIPSARDAAQILIRNADAVPETADVDDGDPVAVSDRHIAALVRLVRAVARRELPPGYGIHAGGGSPAAGLTLVETWRGPRLAALVFEAGPSVTTAADGAAGLAGTIARNIGAGRVAALWLAAPGTGPRGGRLAVAVMENAATGAPR